MALSGAKNAILDVPEPKQRRGPKEMRRSRWKYAATIYGVAFGLYALCTLTIGAPLRGWPLLLICAIVVVGESFLWKLFGKREQNTPPMTIDNGLSAVMNAANRCLAAAVVLESTNIEFFNKTLSIAFYEPDRFESDNEYSEARTARDAVVDAQEAANRLKGAAMVLAMMLKASGDDLSATDFAEVSSKALKIDNTDLAGQVAALRDAADAAAMAVSRVANTLRHRTRT